jgi:ABC-type proline/glycine betaine transport system permease subunit
VWAKLGENTLYAIGLPVVLVVLWGIWATVAPAQFFPSPAELVEAFVDTWIGPAFVTDVLPSVARLAVGILISIVVGIAFGALIGLNRWLRDLLEPMLEFFRAVPPPVLLPIVVVLMGPTGTPTEIPRGETVVLAGGGLGNAVLFSIGRGLRAAGSKVIYFAGYKTLQDRYRVEDIEAASDVVVWCCDQAPGFAPRRAHDRTFVGNIVQAMQAYASGALGDQSIPFSATDRIIAIGSDRMMAAVALARHGVLKDHLKPGHIAIGSINSPMQCMMKEICAQCLQPHVDPATGNASYVFSCFNQDQPLDQVDFGALSQRLGQNSVHEKLTAQWITHSLKQLDRPRATA